MPLKGCMESVSIRNRDDLWDTYHNMFICISANNGGINSSNDTNTSNSTM